MDRKFIERVKQVNPIEEVVGEFVELKNNRGLCPFHDDQKHPNLCVDPQRGIAKCFACMDRATDVIGFIMKIKKTDFRKAVEFLASRAGIDLPEISPEEKQTQKEQKKKEKILEATTEFYQTRLNNRKDNPGLKYLRDKGINQETVDKFRIGLASRGGLREHLIEKGFEEEKCVEAGILFIRNARVTDFYEHAIIFPIISYDRIVSMTGRIILERAKCKYLHLKGEMNHLYNEDSLIGADEIIICEGPVDTLMLAQEGYKAVGVLGAQSFKQEYVPKFKNIKSIYTCLDPDYAGKAGTERIAQAFGGDIEVIKLPEGKDIADFFKSKNRDDFEKLKQSAKRLEELKLDEEAPIRIHLMDIDDAKLSDKKIETDVMVCAKGETYHVPRLFTAECRARKCPVANTCPLHNTKRKIYIPSDEKELINFTRLPDNRITTILRKLSPCRTGFTSAIVIEVCKKVTVQELLVAPKATKIRTIIGKDGKKQEVDELGREYRDKKVFVLSAVPETNQYFRATGWIKSSPKSQVATLLIRELTPITDDYQKFDLIPEIIKEFQAFQVFGGEKIQPKIDEILNDLTNNVTNIYGEHRKLALLLQLLTYHSPINFAFDGERLKRGWLEMIMVGDTGQGKTQMFDRLMEFTGLGEFVTGSSATRTGITYSYQQIGDTWFLKWGKYPLNDGKLLFIDEGQALPEEQWQNMSSGRSDGIIRADGIKRGEHSSRTRLIISCNPKDGKTIDDKLCGVTILKRIFRNADIRRFDLAIFLSSSDQSKNIVDIPRENRPAAEQKITSSILHNSICWGWTRKTDEIEFDRQATLRVYGGAKRLLELYGPAKDIPLVTTDIRHKLARIAVSLATLLHSTDSEHRHVVVQEDHVLYAEELLRKLLDHKNCSLNIHANIQRGAGELSDEEYDEFLIDLIREEKSCFRIEKPHPENCLNCNFFDICKADKSLTSKLDLSDDIKLIFAEFITNDIVQRSELASALNINVDTVTKKMRLFKQHKLIVGRSGRSGYIKTSKFNKILKKMIEQESIGK